MDPKESYTSKMQKQNELNQFNKPKISLKVDAIGDNNSFFQQIGETYFIAVGDSVKLSFEDLLKAQTDAGMDTVKKTGIVKSEWKSVIPTSASDGFIVNSKDFKTEKLSALNGQMKIGDKSITFKCNQIGTTTIEYTFGNEIVKTDIKVLGTKDEFASINPNDYTKAIGSKVISRQDQQKYKFNSLNKGYIANNKNYSKLDEARFKMLDDINALLDTAIYLFNQDKTVEASAYIEKTLFGSKISTDVKISDYRKKEIDWANLTPSPVDVKLPNGRMIALTPSDYSALLIPGIYFYSNIDTSGKAVVIQSGSIFGKIPSSKKGAEDQPGYLNYMLPGFETDPTIASWVLNLRNGLTEFTVESRGKQRWRNVTEEENIGRLNYRKDDYIDYLDGDLESSIFYNNKKRIEDINNGKLSAKNTVYQSEHENMDLQGNPLDPSATGWPTTLISDKSKVYKGGSWADRAYWLSAGNRRFLDEDKTSATIGFRCAMDRLGGQRNLNYKKRRR
jgi:hypothetical protein